MNRVPVVLSAIAVAVLAGCAEAPVSPAPPPVVVAPQPAPVATPSGTVVVPATAQPQVIVPPAAPPLRYGMGRIEQLMPAPSAAAAGGSAPSGMQRAGIRMDDGSFQYVDTSAPNLRVGDRVEITRDGYIRYPL